MPIEAGQQLLHYRLIEQIGKGGMGTVWKAQDTSLDRDVAIKLLPPGFAADADRIARFEREAKVLASFNHPGIAGIYGFHADGDTPVLVLELVPGEDLAAILRDSGALPFEQMLSIGRQITEALQAAHTNGIVHRDLKPANLMLTPEGCVKVLDFGLAKASAAGQASDNPSMSPTLTSAGTVAGTILGTAGYMSPEQARGLTADKRSDLWAFGCVLYEMLTGHKTFEGDTASDTLASVLKTDPDWRRLPADTPRALRRLLRRCLEKDPACRLHDAADARLELDDAANAPPEESQATAPSVRSTRSVTLLGIAVMALVAGLLAGRTLVPSMSEPPVRRLFIPVEVPAEADAVDSYSLSLFPMISPDGARVAWIRDGTVIIRRLDQSTGRPVEGLPRASGVFWSPDGEQLGVIAARELWRVSFDGGRAERVCTTPGSVVDAGWGPDGAITMIIDESEIHTVPARGGDPVKIADRRTEGVEGYFGLAVPPDGRGYVVSLGSPDDMRLELRDGNRRVELLKLGAWIGYPRYVQPGYLLYMRLDANDGLWALPVKPGAAAPAGDPFIVLQDLRPGSAAADGTLVYMDHRRSKMQQIVWATMDGEVESVVGEPRKRIRDVSPSPDGQRVVFSAMDDGVTNLWLHDIGSESTTQLTFGEGMERRPVWSADSTTLFYTVSDDVRSRGQLYSIETDGGSSPWPLGDGFLPDVSSDGSTLVYCRAGEKTGSDIYRRPVGEAEADERPMVVLGGAADEIRPKLSPNGDWMAYVSNASGRREVYLTSFPSGEGRWQVSFEGGEDPQWSDDGGAVYFEWSRRLYKVEVAPKGNELSVSSAQLLIDGNSYELYPWWGYHVSTDGTRLMTVREVPNAEVERPKPGIHVVENWVRAFYRGE